MELHGMISQSRVNGPGSRAVIWFQGCSLACPGCWNPLTHAIGIHRQKSVKEVCDWILSCVGIEGVTFSGGEPFQQAEDLLEICEFVKAKRADLSLGVFSGYSQEELIRGRWHYRREDRSDIPGSPQLFQRITALLDFAILGRFAKSKLSHTKPLCGSANQQIIFFSDRYSATDLPRQACEILVSLDGDDMTLTGFPSPRLIQSLQSR